MSISTQLHISTLRVTINKSRALPLMDPELQEFAEYLGLTGIDSDLFYESYYGVDIEAAEQLLEEYHEVY